MRFTPIDDAVSERTFAAALDSVTLDPEGLAAVSAAWITGRVTRGTDALFGRIGFSPDFDTVVGNPEVQVRIRVLPGGEVLDITVTKRSGNPTYDSSIERGIRSASPLPVPPANSELFPQFRELSLNIRHER